MYNQLVLCNQNKQQALVSKLMLLRQVVIKLGIKLGSQWGSEC